MQLHILENMGSGTTQKKEIESLIANMSSRKNNFDIRTPIHPALLFWSWVKHITASVHMTPCRPGTLNHIIDCSVALVYFFTIPKQKQEV